MKIAVASEDKIHVSGHLGRCRGFLVFDIENNQIKDSNYLQNTFTNHMRSQGQHTHGHNHGDGHGHDRLVKALGDCEYLIFSSGGRRVIDDLEAANIKPILTNEPKVDDAINKFLNNELEIKEDSGCTH